ncbi:unnamed protein product [Rhizoctonia solani]|uniref:Uncharacterized protein n=1 Tax=Rhizoctonia solani TaxID=456999 RepID=A0A8H3HZR0_9AGAM|nr:unnamed protein product [Rhizoctonia solani]
MSFGQEEEELDWGDAGDVVSLGDEDEIPCIAATEENIGEGTAPIQSAQDEDFESAVMSTKGLAVPPHPLGLSHLPPKPQPALHHRRSRETIKASSMSRTYRANSPGAGDDLPRHWEVRRTETVIYYYHTEARCSQLKRPTRDDARLDKFHWKGDAPPNASNRPQSARNPPSVRTGPAEWPERSPPDQQNRSSARDKSPTRPSPPRQRSPKPRPRSDSSLQPASAPAPARAMSPSSMLLPRRGASPARGLAKSNKPDIGVSSDPQDNRNGRSRDSGWEQRGRSNARERDISRNNARMDHYSPPPETGDSPRRGSRHRSISPSRKVPMRSDAMMINQRGTFYYSPYNTRRSLSPRDRDDARAYERPQFDHVANDTRYGRDYPIDLRRGGGEYHTPREDHFRASNGRVPNQFPPGPEPAPPPQESASFPAHTEDTGYPAPPSAKFRDARFARPENRRAQSSRSANVRSARIEPQENDPRLSPVALRNEIPLPPRHEFISPRDGASSHRRPRNGDVRDRMMPEGRGLAISHDPISPSHVERDLHPDVRQDDHIPRHGHRHSVSGGEYMAGHSLSPQITRERELPDISPPRHSYSGRPRDFPPQELAEPRESDFRPRDREPERYPPKARREQHEPYPRGLRQEDSMTHVYEAPTVPHARRIVPRDSEALAPGRIFSPTEPQRPPSPVSAVRETYPRRYVRDDQFADHTRDWGHEDQAQTPPEEPRPAERKPPPDARRAQREAVSDTEFVDSRGGRSRRREGRPRFEKPEADGRPNYKRRVTHEDNQPYEPEDRQWTPRDAPSLLPRARSPVAQMEVDPPLVPLPEKQLAGWINFRRHRERSQEHREPFRSHPGARDSWHPTPTEDQDVGVEIIEGGKRQRIEGGTRMTQSFNHREEDLPRKIPQHSPSQRPKIHSPNHSTLKLPPPALTVQPVVDFQAAVSRAKDVASQLTQANPQHKPRRGTRFDQPSGPDMATGREIDRGLLVPNGSSGPFGAANPSETTVSSEINERSSPEGANGDRHGSEGSHSSHIVLRMDEASLRDNGYPQAKTCRTRSGSARCRPVETRPKSERAKQNGDRHGSEGSHSKLPLQRKNGLANLVLQKRAERNRDRPDAGPSRRDRNRYGRNNGEKSSRFVDSYRPGDETPGRGPGGMRAWGNPDAEPQRDPPPHTSTATNRTYRKAADRGFPRPQVITSPEGLPPRPPTPTEFARGARNRGQTAGQIRSPPGKGSRSFTVATDADTTDAATDVRYSIRVDYPY